MIVPLLAVTLIGRQAQKHAVIDDLQALGCLEIIPLRHPEAGVPGGASPEAREALRYLRECPTQRRQERAAGAFDPAIVQAQALATRNRAQELTDRRDVLLEQIRQLRPWGEFALPRDGELAGYRLWFYVVPHDAVKRLDLSRHPHVLVRKDSRLRYYVLVAKEQPDLPVAPLRVDATPQELSNELDRLEVELEELHIQRVHLSRWRDRLAGRLDGLDDLAAREQAAQQTLEGEPVFALRAWCPAAFRDKLVEYATEKGLAATVAAPGARDTPPTLLANPPRGAAGEGLVNFYMTPGYFTWDPSRLVLVSFAVFFAMIVADFGYAALMGLILLLMWRRLGTSTSSRRFRTVFSAIVAASLVYGVLVGSYFGWAPAPHSLLGRLAVIDATDATVMMRATILIGIAHLVYANVRRAMIRPWRAEAMSPAGWAAVLVGAAVLWLGREVDSRATAILGVLAMIAGGACVVLYAQPRQKLPRRLLGGAIGLTRVTSAFGDVLSYLRLFALGLASASLAVAFNNLASQTRSAAPRIGLVLAILVLLIGHTLNLVLSLMSGVVHGLRLNVIEFFNWGLPEEGRPFRAFRRKETSYGPVGTDGGLDRDLRTGGAGGHR